MSVLVAVPARADLHPLDFEVGGVVGIQESGGDSESGFLAWTPQWNIAPSYGLKLSLGAAPFRATTQNVFFAFHAMLYVTARPLAWFETDGKSGLQLEAGGGSDYWAVVGGLPFPSFGGQITYHFSEKLWIWERVVLGYRLAMLSGVPTHIGYLGIGISIF